MDIVQHTILAFRAGVKIGFAIGDRARLIKEYNELCKDFSFNHRVHKDRKELIEMRKYFCIKANRFIKNPLNCE